jgi:hypothetical protein
VWIFFVVVVVVKTFLYRVQLSEYFSTHIILEKNIFLRSRGCINASFGVDVRNNMQGMRTIIEMLYDIRENLYLYQKNDQSHNSVQNSSLVFLSWAAGMVIAQIFCNSCCCVLINISFLPAATASHATSHTSHTTHPWVAHTSHTYKNTLSATFSQSLHFQVTHLDNRTYKDSFCKNLKFFACSSAKTELIIDTLVVSSFILTENCCFSGNENNIVQSKCLVRNDRCIKQLGEDTVSQQIGK